jgi:hypothetical protein
MADVSPLRLNLLRAGYLLLGLGLGSVVWPGVIRHDQPWELSRGVVHCILAALSALALLGLRYPLRMLPLLLFEMAWKAIWLLVVALPLSRSGGMDADTAETAYECLMAVAFVLVTPWDHVFRAYVIGRAEPWRRPVSRP